MIEVLLVGLLVVFAVAAAMIPLLSRRDAEPLDRQPLSEQALDREIEAYRVALRAGTLCRRCGVANPEGSRFCMECGRRLPAAA